MFRVRTRFLTQVKQEHLERGNSSIRTTLASPTLLPCCHYLQHRIVLIVQALPERDPINEVPVPMHMKCSLLLLIIFITRETSLACMWKLNPFGVVCEW